MFRLRDCLSLLHVAGFAILINRATAEPQSYFVVGSGGRSPDAGFSTLSETFTQEKELACGGASLRFLLRRKSPSDSGFLNCLMYRQDIFRKSQRLLGKHYDRLANPVQFEIIGFS